MHTVWLDTPRHRIRESDVVPSCVWCRDRSTPNTKDLLSPLCSGTEIPRGPTPDTSGQSRPPLYVATYTWNGRVRLRGRGIVMGPEDVGERSTRRVEVSYFSGYPGRGRDPWSVGRSGVPDSV